MFIFCNLCGSKFDDKKSQFVKLGLYFICQKCKSEMNNHFEKLKSEIEV